MTITSAEPRIQLVATAGQTVFPYNFEIFDEDDLVVQQTVNATGVTTTLTIVTNYTVSGVGNDSGGNVTLTVGAAVSDVLTVFSDQAAERTSDFQQGGDFLAATVNTEFDTDINLIKQVQRDVDRAFTLKTEDITSSIELPLEDDRKNKFLAFDGSGVPIAASATTGTAGVSTFWEPILLNSDAATSRSDLDSEQIATSLTAVTTLQDADQFIFADASDSNNSKKITKANLATALGSSAINPNIIINGNMDIAQRGASFVAAANNDMTLDRFLWTNSGTGVVTITQDSASVPDGSEFAQKVDVTTADTSLAATDQYTIGYFAEGKDTSVIKSGTSSAEAIVLTFYVRSTITGTYHVAFRNSANDRSYPASYTVDVADTWEQKTITLTADVTGTWLDGINTIGMRINFIVAVGSNKEGTANAWQAGSFFSAAGAANGMSSTSNSFHVTQVKLEIGSAATEFQLNPIADELILARRYYERLTSLAVNEDVSPSYNTSTTVAAGILNYQVEKMKAPTISFSGQTDFEVAHAATQTVTTAIAGAKINTNLCKLTATVASGLTAGQGSSIRFVAASDFIEIEAEL